jgi:23S rRNA (pseudouridine1915-N3)-methyltransferase
MKIVLLTIGKTSERYLLDGIQHYQNRLKYYMPFEIIEIPNIKKAQNLSKTELKRKEGLLITQYIQSSDYIILLDDKGKTSSSLEFAQKLESWLNSGKKRLLFVVGGAYGFSDEIYSKAPEKCSLSKMTFSHQMVRLFFAEQLYRAFTILKNEPYHHE